MAEEVKELHAWQDQAFLLLVLQWKWGKRLALPVLRSGCPLVCTSAWLKFHFAVVEADRKQIPELTRHAGYLSSVSNHTLCQ
jgi:hypothetical protein